jgi:hypothetical protein
MEAFKRGLLYFMAVEIHFQRDIFIFAQKQALYSEICRKLG